MFGVLEHRSNFTTVVMENKLYAFGGYDGNSTISVVECYDQERDHGPEWTFVCPMNLPKSALGVAVLPMCIKPFSYLDHMQCLIENPEDCVIFLIVISRLIVSAYQDVTIVHCRPT